MKTLALSAAYIATIATANLATTHFNLVHLGPIAVTAGTFAIGLSFVARDALHESAGRRRIVLAAIAAAAAISGALSPAQLVVASGLTILAAELADMAVFTRLRERHRLGAWIASNVVAAPIDSVLFLWLAGFPLAGWWGQTAVKVAVGTLIPLLFARALRKEVTTSDLLRHRLHRASA
ncbi:VUT family protein [Micromonospora sp. NPDC047465]|uniref:VUT family protein n=1 Tax=Micromonospora sp. NPDC047465 TaxID=3154813 RepID=UPI0033EDAB56